MRNSRVLRIMRQGGVAVSAKFNLNDAREAEIAARCGYDCVWIDFEHVPNGIDSVNHYVQAAKIYDCDLIARVKRGSYSDLICPLEADATGIMVPHLMSLEDAKKIVYYTKFYPVGRRPVDGGNADGAYTMLDANEYIKKANEERFVIVQIEDPEPMAELEEICALPGLDMIFFGPADYSQGIGKPFQFDAPELQEARVRIAKTARKHGKFAGTVGTAANFDELAALGYQFINIVSDVGALADYWGNTISRVNPDTRKNGGKRL